MVCPQDVDVDVYPLVFLYNNGTILESIDKELKEMYGQNAYGRITQVPNKKKNIDDFMIEYDKKKGLVDGVVHDDLYTLIPGSSLAKDLLKQSVQRVNVIDYRFVKRKRRKRKKNDTTVTEESCQTSSVFLGAILNENADNKNDGVHNITEISDIDSLSDDGLECNLKNLRLREVMTQMIADLVDTEDENDYMSKEWTWISWRDIGEDEEIPGPPENDQYNGPHGLKKVIGDRFDTVLQCTMNTTTMNLKFFERLAAQSNKYARNDMKTRNSTLYIGRKWENIRAGEMIRFFGIMLRISLEPRKMGG